MNQKDLNPRLGQNEPELVIATQLENGPINLADDLFNQPVVVSELSGPSVLIEVSYKEADTLLSQILWQWGMAAIPEDDIAVITKPIKGRGIGRRVVQITVPIQSAANSVTRVEADISHKPSGNDVVGESRSDTSEETGEELSRSLQPGGRGLRVVERNTNTRLYRSNSIRSLRKRHPSEGQQQTLGRKVQGILYDANRTMHGVVVRVGDVIDDLQSMIEGRQKRKEFLAHSPAEAVLPQVNERTQQLIIESIVYDPGLGLKAPLTDGHNTQAGFAHAIVVSPRSGEYGVYAGGELNYIHEPQGADFTQIKSEEKVTAQVLSYQILEKKAKVLALIAHVDPAYRDQVELTVSDDLKYLDTMFNLLVSSWGIDWSWNELKELARTKIDAQQVAYKVSEVIGAGAMALAACAGSGAPVEIPPVETQQAGEVLKEAEWVALPVVIPKANVEEAANVFNLSDIQLFHEAESDDVLTALARADSTTSEVETLWYLGDGLDASGQVVKFMVQAKTKTGELNAFRMVRDNSIQDKVWYWLANQNGVDKYWFSASNIDGVDVLMIGEAGNEFDGWLMQTMKVREQEILPTSEAPGDVVFWGEIGVAQAAAEGEIPIDPSPVLPPTEGVEPTESPQATQAPVMVYEQDGKTKIVGWDGTKYKQLVDAQGLGITGEAVVPLTVAGQAREGQVVVMENGRPRVLVDEATLTVRELSMERNLFENGVWYEYQAESSQFVEMPIPVPDPSTYVTALEQVPEQHQAEFASAPDVFPHLDKETGPVVKAWSNRLNKVVYIAQGVGEYADKIVGLYNFDNNGLVWRAYGFDTTLLITSNPQQVRFQFRRKIDGFWHEKRDGYLLFVNFLRSALFANASKITNGDIPEAAFNPANMFFVAGEGRELFSVDSELVAYENGSVPFDIPQFFIARDIDANWYSVAVRNMDGFVVIYGDSIGYGVQDYFGSWLRFCPDSYSPRYYSFCKAMGVVQSDNEFSTR